MKDNRLEANQQAETTACDSQQSFQFDSRGKVYDELKYSIFPIVE